MEEIKKIRYDFIDLLKLIAIVMVIILHCVPLNYDFINHNTIKGYFIFLLRTLCEGVLIFVSVNGFLILNKPLDLKKHYGKILKIFWIFILWSILDIIVIKLLNNEQLSINNIIDNILKTDISNKYTGPLWFLQNLITLYLVFPVLKVVHDNNKKVYNGLFICVSFFTVGINLIWNSILIFQGLTHVKIDSIYGFLQKFNPISNGVFIFFFMLGGYIFEYKEMLQERKKKFWGILIGVISSIIAVFLGVLISKTTGKNVSGGFNYGTIFYAGIIISLFTTFYKYKNNNRFYNKLITDLGRNSLGIYLVHKIIISIVNKYIIYLQVSWFKVLMPVMIIVISYMLVKIIKKIPIIHRIIEI